MKALLNRSIFLISGAVIIGVMLFSGCGSKDDAKNTEVKTEPIKKETQPPAAKSDSQPTHTPVQPDTLITGKTKTELKTDLKKEMTPPEKKKEAEPVKKTTTPVVAEKKEVATPVSTNPVKQPDPIPVVKPTEPVKPVMETQPVKTEPVKPVVNATLQPQPGGWIVPEKYKSMTSPYAVNSETLENGSSVYGLHCKSCHGSKGEGNGPKAETLDTKIRSFLSSGFLSQKSGEVYYKSIFGRGDMPKFDKKIPDEEDRWAVVHYIMSLKK